MEFFLQLAQHKIVFPADVQFCYRRAKIVVETQRYLFLVEFEQYSGVGGTAQFSCNFLGIFQGVVCGCKPVAVVLSGTRLLLAAVQYILRRAAPDRFNLGIECFEACSEQG
ncbi:MAG: hypothetical protein EA364_04370 [Balneolaceae bacterium]|nr:MAG: hypothetical protein EA364_04370 [Balneolaceae bacterium]